MTGKPDPDWHRNWPQQRTARSQRGYITSVIGGAMARSRERLGLGGGRYAGGGFPPCDRFQGWRPKTCQYPHGDVGEPGFHFCGAAVREGSSYCDGHHDLCHEKHPRKPVEGLAGLG